MKKITLLFFFLSFILIGMQAQERSSFSKIRNQNDTISIKKLDNLLIKKGKIDSINVKNFIKKFNLKEKDYRRIEGITPTGIPIKITNNSRNQINATNTNLITNNRVSGFNLTALGITAHVFDEGAILKTHNEFDNRVSNYKNNTKIIKEHPTLVAGVIAAKGLNAEAVGMATNIKIVGDTFLSNRLLRMNEVARSGVLISNHSYGFQNGWDNGTGDWRWWGDDSIDILEDYSFGFYGDSDKIIDQISLFSPYHLHVRSAANSNGINGFGPENNELYYLNNTNIRLNTKTRPRRKNCYTGFDCIPTGSLSKNILVVGSVDPVTNPSASANIQLSYFSSVGPTDDGRIKPDVVAVGSEVLTTSFNSKSSYSTVEGTSFSSPSVAGIAALLQEQYFNTKLDYMRSDLVKALLINTTNEAGSSTGPDYKFGWGLVDAYKAAMIIKNNGNSSYLDQLTLTEGGNCSMEIKANAGSSVKVTLAWIDKEYTSYTPDLNNRTKTLVNDLDIRVYEKNNPSIIHYPWKLDVVNPAAAATKGDNSIDNVEQVEFTSNTTREYIVEVKHKGNLVNPTKYSIVANALAKTFCQSNTEENLTLHFLDNNRIYVRFPLNNELDKYEFFIYDFSGKLIRKSTEIDYQISLSKFNLQRGNYIAQAKSNGKVNSIKFSIN